MDGPAHFDPSATPAPGGLKAPDDLPRALADLRASGWESVPVADEMRRNTAKAIAAGHSLVPGVLGFEDTVVPQLENAILAGHDLILLGERGQAKTRVIRSLVGLLDEWLPIVAGSEINDDPYNPVSRFALDLVDELGEATPIDWVHRSQRYGEKLATPDTSIADLIGEVDPIKIAEGRYLSDELALHYGLIPGSTGTSSPSTSSRTSRSGSRSGCSTSSRSATSRSGAIASGCRSTSCSSPRRTRRTTPTAAASSRRSRTASARRSGPTTRSRRNRSQDHGERGRPANGQRARLGAPVHEGGGGRGQPAGPAQHPPQPAQRCLGPPVHRQLRDSGGLRRAACPADRRAGGGAPDQ